MKIWRLIRGEEHIFYLYFKYGGYFEEGLLEGAIWRLIRGEEHIFYLYFKYGGYFEEGLLEGAFGAFTISTQEFLINKLNVQLLCRRVNVKLKRDFYISGRKPEIWAKSGRS